MLRDRDSSSDSDSSNDGVGTDGVAAVPSHQEASATDVAAARAMAKQKAAESRKKQPTGLGFLGFVRLMLGIGSSQQDEGVREATEAGADEAISDDSSDSDSSDSDGHGTAGQPATRPGEAHDVLSDSDSGSSSGGTQSSSSKSDESDSG